jgi:hypothetical protein
MFEPSELILQNITGHDPDLKHESVVGKGVLGCIHSVISYSYSFTNHIPTDLLNVT